MIENNNSTREDRLRAAAQSDGFCLEKADLQDPDALDYGTYRLVDEKTSAVVARLRADGGYGLDLDDIEEALAERGQQSFRVVRVAASEPPGQQQSFPAVRVTAHQMPAHHIEPGQSVRVVFAQPHVAAPQACRELDVLHCEREWQAFRRKYGHLKEFADIVSKSR